jgi:hypothetical protein
MKKPTLKTILFLLLSFGLTFSTNSFAAGPPPTILPVPGPVVVDGRKLMVDFDRDGIYVPFFVKGVGYAPIPIGHFRGGEPGVSDLSAAANPWLPRQDPGVAGIPGGRAVAI